MRDKDWHREFEVLKGSQALVLSQLTALIQQGEKKMSEISDAIAALTTEVQETTGAVQSALVFIQGLKDQIQALIDAGAVTPAQLQELAAQLDANQQALAAAITTNPTP